LAAGFKEPAYGDQEPCSPQTDKQFLSIESAYFRSRLDSTGSGSDISTCHSVPEKYPCKCKLPTGLFAKIYITRQQAALRTWLNVLVSVNGPERSTKFLWSSERSETNFLKIKHGTFFGKHLREAALRLRASVQPITEFGHIADGEYLLW